MSTNVAAGEKVPLFLSVGDKNEGLYVKVDILGPTGTTITTLDLEHLRSGLYGYRSYTMPDIEFINAAYTVWEDDAYTIPADYYDATESFPRASDGQGDPEGEFDEATKLEAITYKNSLNIVQSDPIKLSASTDSKLIKLESYQARKLSIRDYDNIQLICDIDQVNLSLDCHE